jgi:N-acetylmuramoyl-L-alanine amidase
VIENVAADAGGLPDGQAQATAALISRIVCRHRSIRYLIGHYQYRDDKLPHHRLLIERDAAYRFTDKVDPGPVFMARVRQLLKELYGLTLSD